MWKRCNFKVFRCPERENLFLQGGAVLATLIQRQIAKLDEYGEKAVGGKDLVHGEDKRAKTDYDKIIMKYKAKLFDLVNDAT